MSGEITLDALKFKKQLEFYESEVRRLEYQMT